MLSLLTRLKARREPLDFAQIVGSCTEEGRKAGASWDNVNVADGRRRIEEDVEREIKEQHFGQKYNHADFFQTEGFLDDFEKELERMKAMFLSLKFTDGRGTHRFNRHELESFDRFLSSLRKLR